MNSSANIIQIMKNHLLFFSLAALIHGFPSCTNDKSPLEAKSKNTILENATVATKPPTVNWLIKSKDFDDMSLVHQVSLVVNGQEHKIDNEVYSLKNKSDYALHDAEDRKSYHSLSGYNFEWHVSSADFYVKEEGAHLVVYAEESSDENEGKASTRKIKTISLKE